MQNNLCTDPHLMALNLMRCACREACHGCVYESYGKTCENLQLDDNCIDRMMREAAAILDPSTIPTMRNLAMRDIRERSADGKTEERDG